MTLIVFAGALSAACTYRGDIDDPTTIKATWFSYLNGDDIRARCSESSGLRYRLIYNADYDEQLRSYEVIGDGAGGIEAATLISRVHGLGRLPGNRLSLSDPLAWARWTKSVTPLSAEQLDLLNAALEQSEAFGPAPKGLQLFSKETYWVSSLCRDGVFSFNAWRFPSGRYEAISFDELLFALDDTGIGIREPAAVPVGASARASVPRRQQSVDERGNFFNVKVGKNGLEDYLAF